MEVAIDETRLDTDILRTALTGLLFNMALKSLRVVALNRSVMGCQKSLICKEYKRMCPRGLVIRQISAQVCSLGTSLN